MKRILIFVIAGFVLSGCATLEKPSTRKDVSEKDSYEEPQKVVSGSPDTSPELQNIKEEELGEYVQKKGIIFAKTNFQGLLKTRYVKLLFEDQEDSAHKFQLHIGENSEQQTFPWNVKTVKPGYFFVELPAGKYKISSVSIPVGSTTATEEIDISLEVIPNAICYAGTLKMVGTKEKIKLGGLPIIKPGFEYTVEILDEREEGAEAFRRNYPNFSNDITTKLMRVNVALLKK